MKKAILFSIILGCLFTASARSVDKDHLISKTSIGRAKLGMTFKKFISYFIYDTVNVGDYGRLNLIKNDKVIIALSDNKLGKDSIVRWANIISDEYYTRDGIHVGTTIKEFLRVYKKEKMQNDEPDGIGFFAPGSQNISFLVRPFDANKPLYHDSNVDENGVVNKYSTKGYIFSIILYLVE